MSQSGYMRCPINLIAGLGGIGCSQYAARAISSWHPAPELWTLHGLSDASHLTSLTGPYLYTGRWRPAQDKRRCPGGQASHGHDEEVTSFCCVRACQARLVPCALRRLAVADAARIAYGEILPVWSYKNGAMGLASIDQPND